MEGISRTNLNRIYEMLMNDVKTEESVNLEEKHLV